MLHEQTLLWQRKTEGNVKWLWVVELVLSCCDVKSNISTSRPGPKVDRLFANSHELSENATMHTALWHVLGLRSCPATRLNKRSQSWVSSAFLPSIPCSLKAKWFLLVRSCASTGVSCEMCIWHKQKNEYHRTSSNIPRSVFVGSLPAPHLWSCNGVGLRRTLRITCCHSGSWLVWDTNRRRLNA